MKTYRFDESKVVVTPGNAVEMFRRALKVANGEATERLVSAVTVAQWFSDCFDCRKLPGKSCRFWRDGGGVKYSQGNRCRTGVFGVAWFPTAPTRLHVRVIGDRIDAPMSPEGNRGVEKWGLPWWMLSRIHPLALVYPVLHITPEDESLWSAGPINLQALKDVPWDADLWWEMEDWARETLPRLEFLRIATARVVAETVENTFLGPCHPEY